MTNLEDVVAGDGLIDEVGHGDPGAVLVAHLALVAAVERLAVVAHQIGQVLRTNQTGQQQIRRTAFFLLAVESQLDGAALTVPMRAARE